jgi:diguanylate cyclase (GGDEF)-like protein
MATIYRLRIIAFSILLSLFIASIILSFIILERQQYHAALINVVGRQRMLAQQMALEAVLAQAFPDANYRQALHDTSHNKFETTLTALTEGGQIILPTGETFIIQPASDADILEQLQSIHVIWEDMDQAIHVVIEKNSQSEDINSNVEKIISLSPRLIFELDKTARLYEIASNRNIAHLQIIQLGFLAAAILVLGALIVITNRRVLRPIQSLGDMVTRIGKGDLKTPVAVTGLEEIDLLAKNLDEMREKLSTNLQTQTALVALSQCHLKVTEEEKAIECAVRTAAQVLKADYSAVALLDPEGRLILRAAWGISTKRLKGTELEQGDKSQTGYTILRGEPILVQDYSKLTEFSVPPLVSRYKISSGLSVPMLSRGRIVGAMLAHSKTPRHFDQDAIPKLSLIANQTALTVDKIRLLAETRQFAFTDELTGLYNRRHFIQLAEKEVDRAIRYRHSQAFIMFDLDRFKRVNDAYGHPAGDQVLKTVASLARHELRDIDLLGRYGGEEFVILLPETGRKGARAIAERLRKRISQTRITVAQEKIPITISLGVSTLSSRCNSLTQLIEASDKALYAAKEGGRNRTRCASS